MICEGCQTELTPTTFGHCRICLADLCEDCMAQSECENGYPHAALESAVSTIEQLIPEPSARGVADVVLVSARLAISRARGTP